MSTENIEFEGKILAIDDQKVRDTILVAGGKLVGEYDFKRYVFNTIPMDPNRWMRLRTNGQKTTLAIKQIDSDEIDGTSEWEVDVSDFETTLTIIKKSGLTPKGYQENKRVEFEMQDCMLSIDYWPHLDAYLEIEGPSKAAVEKMAVVLGFQASQLIGDNTEKLYKRNGMDLKQIPELRFPESK